MTKRQQDNRIKKIEKEWEEQAHPFNDGIDRVYRFWKRETSIFTNYMMYRKRPSNKADRFADTLLWWFIMTIIFFAYKGFCYTLFGR
jgi:hypothetical protein